MISGRCPYHIAQPYVCVGNQEGNMYTTEPQRNTTANNNINLHNYNEAKLPHAC